MQVEVASIDITVGGRKFRAGQRLVDVAEKNLVPMRRLQQCHLEEWPDEAIGLANAADELAEADTAEVETPEPKPAKGKKAPKPAKGKKGKPAEDFVEATPEELEALRADDELPGEPINRADDDQ